MPCGSVISLASSRLCAHSFPSWSAGCLTKYDVAMGVRRTVLPLEPTIEAEAYVYAGEPGPAPGFGQTACLRREHVREQNHAGKVGFRAPFSSSPQSFLFHVSRV